MRPPAAWDATTLAEIRATGHARLEADLETVAVARPGAETALVATRDRLSRA